MREIPPVDETKEQRLRRIVRECHLEGIVNLKGGDKNGSRDSQ